MTKRIVIMTGVTPDGDPLTVQVDVLLDDARMCPAEHGDGFRACCTLSREHPGPWHVATTHERIIKIWPVQEGGEHD